MRVISEVIVNIFTVTGHVWFTSTVKQARACVYTRTSVVGNGLHLYSLYTYIIYDGSVPYIVIVTRRDRKVLYTYADVDYSHRSFPSTLSQGISDFPVTPIFPYIQYIHIYIYNIII